jgi:hypothetical protein
VHRTTIHSTTVVVSNAFKATGVRAETKGEKEKKSVFFNSIL